MNYKNLVNIIGFYFCWWMSIYGAINEKYFLGIAILFVYILFHFIFISNSNIEYYYILICFILSFVSDSLFMYCDFITYKGYMPDNFNVIPLWTLSLWISFSLSIFHSFSFLRKKYLQASIMGAISGPVIYYSTSKAGLIVFNINQNSALLLIVFIWSLLLPLYFFIADKLIENHAT